MTAYLICQFCGYVLTKEELEKEGECPTCGVKAKAFKPYELPVDEKRWKFLRFHIHPILVHFPEAIVPGLILSTFLILFFNGTIGEILSHVTSVLGIILPFVVITAIISGVVDGKVRYKKIKSKFLKLKIVVGSIVFALSITIGLLVYILDLTKVGSKITLLILAIITFGGTGFLGFLGGKLNCNLMRDNK